MQCPVCIFIERKRVAYKVYADSGDIALRVGIVCETEEQTTLADTAVADKQQFEEVVAAIKKIQKKEREGEGQLFRPIP